MTLPANDGHPVKQVNYATEVNHDKTDRNEKDIPETTFAEIQGGSFGPGGGEFRLAVDSGIRAPCGEPDYEK